MKNHPLGGAARQIESGAAPRGRLHDGVRVVALCRRGLQRPEASGLAELSRVPEGARFLNSEVGSVRTSGAELTGLLVRQLHREVVDESVEASSADARVQLPDL